MLTRGLRRLARSTAPPCPTPHAALCTAPQPPLSAPDATPSADDPPGEAASAPPPPPPPRPDLSPLLHPSCPRRLALASMLRVDHAGEAGAVAIYAGQRAVLGGDASVGATLDAMASHEVSHLAAFSALLPRYRTRPTALLPLWRAAGFALGAGSAALGPAAAFAVTEAVESVITAHYDDQLRELHALGREGGDGGGDEPELRALVRSCRDDEQEHLDEAVRRGARDAPGYAALSAVVKVGCAAAIALAKRV